jgi:hypothetical protein
MFTKWHRPPRFGTAQHGTDCSSSVAQNQLKEWSSTVVGATPVAKHSANIRLSHSTFTFTFSAVIRFYGELE